MSKPNITDTTGISPDERDQYRDFFTHDGKVVITLDSERVLARADEIYRELKQAQHPTTDVSHLTIRSDSVRAAVIAILEVISSTIK